MPISYNHKKIFIHIPRCAGTSVAKVLNTNSYEELYASSRIDQTSIFIEKNKFKEYDYAMCAYKSPQYLTYKELEKVVPNVYFSKFFIFTIVRNPYDRLVSSYHHFMKISKMDKDMDIPECSFENFLQYLKNDQLNRNDKFDGHLETQTHYLSNSNAEISKNIKIYKFENINECFLDLQKYQDIPHLEKTEDRKHYSEYYYNDSIKEVVYNFYKNDFINFNYDIRL